MYNIHVQILKGVIQYMNKIQLVKKYTYISICNIDFNVLIYFDYDNEVLLYSLSYEDNNYSSYDYLIEYASCFEEERFNNTIKSFMLDYVWSQINCYIEENDYNDWRILIIEDGLKLKNTSTNQWVTWNIHDYDEDYEVIQNKIIKFLKLQSTTK